MSKPEKQNKLKPVASALATVITSSMALGAVSTASANPFQVTDLGSGYMQLAEGSCGEGKCGAKKDKAEGGCGGAKGESEGSCGEGKCGAKKDKAEGNCGGAKGKSEGSCGGAKDNAEGSCGGGA